MLCKRCRSSHKEDNKFGFAFLGFFVILYGFYKTMDLFTKESRIYLCDNP
jgi:hypothetical protein